ncbi:MAG: phosphotransferase [Deltaproteobacteria bacterium]|nr:phosphotransferase [Deltaproteobacteria bacterium]
MKDLTHFGPLEEHARHAGVQVLRLLAPETSLVWLKIHDHVDRAQREAALLNASLPLARPVLVLSEALPKGRWLLGMEDARAGRDSACRRLPAESLPAMAGLLGRLAGQHISEVPGGRHRGTQLAARLERLKQESALKEAFKGLLLLGDGLCHGDLHPSNWLMEAGQPVGLLDWATVHYGDPEADLARLFAEAGFDLLELDTVVGAWQLARGHDLDQRRLLLYVCLEASERKASQEVVEKLQEILDHHEPSLGARPRKIAGIPITCKVPGASQIGVQIGVPGTSQGTSQSEKVAPDWIVEEASDTEVLALLEDLDQPTALGWGAPSAVWRFGRHACNLVLRLDWPDRPSLVCKLYRKPVAPWLFAMEDHLAGVLRNLHVPGPLLLGSGGWLLRSLGRPAACYPLLAGSPLRSDAPGASLLARALAELHACLDELPPVLRVGLPEFPLHLEQDLPPTIEDLNLASNELEAYSKAWAFLKSGLLEASSSLPEGLLHGSLNRDHTLLLSDGTLACFDLEKLSFGPRILDLVQSATYLAYRNRDEVPDPALWIHFLGQYNVHALLNRSEKTLLPLLLLRCAFEDLRHMREEGMPHANLRRHVRHLLDFHHNQKNLQSALRHYLGDNSVSPKRSR